MIGQAKLLKIFKLSTGIIIYAEAIIKIYQFHLHYQKKCGFCLIWRPTQATQLPTVFHLSTFT